MRVYILIRDTRLRQDLIVIVSSLKLITIPYSFNVLFPIRRFTFRVLTKYTSIVIHPSIGYYLSLTIPYTYILTNTYSLVYIILLPTL